MILREPNGLAKSSCAFCTRVTRTTGRRLAVAFLLAALTQLLPGQSSNPIHATRPIEYTFKIVRTFPHDPAAFTQGLAYRDGFLYEGTGLKGQSSLRKVRLETGAVVQRVDLTPEFFGEGITLLKNEVVQLTWQSQTGFVYNMSDFRLLRRFRIQGKDGVSRRMAKAMKSS